MTTASSIFVTHGDEGDVDEPFTVKLALKPGKGAAARILRQFCKVRNGKRPGAPLDAEDYALAHDAAGARKIASDDDVRFVIPGGAFVVARPAPPPELKRGFLAAPAPAPAPSPAKPGKATKLKKGFFNTAKKSAGAPTPTKKKVDDETYATTPSIALQPWTQTARGAASEFRDANVRELSHRVADIDMKIDAWATSVQGTRREPTAPLVAQKPEGWRRSYNRVVPDRARPARLREVYTAPSDETKAEDVPPHPTSPVSPERGQVSFRSTASKEARPVKHFAKRGNDFFYHGKGYVHAGGVEIFPRRQKRWFKLVNPTDASYRAWTWLLIPALIWTAVALPFEMAFMGFTLSVHARTASHGGRFLFTVNRACDLYFAADFLLMFSVAYFDNKHDVWILDRRRIAAKYLRGWCVVDLASIVPYDIFADDSYGGVHFLRLMRFSRALKLIRVSRVGRLMDWCILYLGLPFRSVVMLKCGLVFFFTLHWGCVESDRRFGTRVEDLSSTQHWGACSCRMVLDECADPKRYLGDMSNHGQNLYVKCVDEAVIIFGKGVFREYLDALHWSIRAMFGDADAPTMGLDGLAIFLALWGLFITSYLIGEAGTEYRATCDNIRSMARRNSFPPDLRDRLHKFLLHSDAMFHSVFERKMLMGLSPAARKRTAGSPGLQHTIAMEQLGAQVGGIPFFRYAMLRSVKLGKRQRVSVKCWNEDDDEMALRRAVVRRPHGTNGTAVGVDYVDGALPEREDDVILDRIVCGRDPETLRCNREVHAFVRDLSVAATSRAYMTGETLVHQGISWNDELFILVEGRAVVFDATRHAIHGKELVTPRTNAVVGRDICAYLCNRKKVPRKYTCKLLTHSLVYAVDAETFCDLLSRGHYKALYRGMAFYGSWIVLRNALLAWVDERRARPPEKPRRKSGVAAALDAQRDALAALAAKVDALLDRRRPPAADDGRAFLPGA
ncbi:voltage-gated potassium channel [Aureococcus anophagefferens]|nr:voltage-gated potassium channel [Aureococcus anophagefferens]